MNEPPIPLAGADELNRLLAEHTHDVRRLDVDGFRGWLRHHLGRWERDPIFAQRERIRDLRRTCPELGRMEVELRRAERAHRESREHPRIARLERELVGVEQAISGLSAALQAASPDQRSTLQRKHAGFVERRGELGEELRRLEREAPAWTELKRIGAAVDALRVRAGVQEEETRLQLLLEQQGRRSGRAGSDFESSALDLVHRCVLPALTPDTDAVDDTEVRVLRSVRLGAARVELDQVVVRLGRADDRPVEVLAVVEAKRNINDLAHGFRLRQENLAWLTGIGTGYDPGSYRTREFRAGHFDHPALHEESGERFVFDTGSFRLFRPTSAGHYLDRLFFVTRVGPLWGISTAALARIGHRVATDEAWEPDDAGYLSRLLGWCRSLAQEIEAPDVLRMYAEHPAAAGRILLMSR